MQNRSCSSRRSSTTLLDRDSIMEYNGSPKLIFGVSFVVWVVWMLASFTLYFSAGNANLLAAAEFSWSFGAMFSVLSPCPFSMGVTHEH
ncbi:hypothetical protein JCM1841_005937 [Sporobolomyces salmonicolor]